MLKALMLRKRIDMKKAELNALREKLDGFKTREAELETAISEVETEEQRTELDEMINSFTQERDEAQGAADSLEQEISELENELQGEEAAQDTTPPADTGNAGTAEAGTETAGENSGNAENRGGNIPMIRRLKNFTAQEREAFLGNEQVRGFLAEIRTAIQEKRTITGVGLTIPEVMLGLVREETYAASKLIKFVDKRNVGGKGRLNIMGKIPEAIWTEMCANLNELDLSFNQVEVDGYKVGGFVALCNAVIEDSDLNLASEVVSAIGIAIAKALDKAILFGTGSKMPVGISTRLAAQSQPAWWGTNEGTFVDLHSTNIQTINVKSSSGAAFFTALVEKLGIAKPKFSGDGLFWAMNRKTHLDILAKALAFNANAALVSNTAMMPILGGDIVEFEDDQLADYEIIGGFGGNYLLAERAGIEFDSSKEVRFLADQTVFKGTARYDGRPVAGEAFVIVNYNNTTPTTTKGFPEDYANADLNTLTLVAAASATNVGKTVITVTDYLADSDPDLQYKVGKVDVAIGQAAPSGFNDLTSGTTEITAAAGKAITVIELDDNDRIVSAGVVASIPKAS